ncbi:MAG: transcription/translation regulatory transformer protein RfaH [Limnohabitans sp.]|jgi:transcriptional antiterminator RfaH|nr:transcription/translation regulatory transformer protein RfaH [Limnohabitans sp.]
MQWFVIHTKPRQEQRALENLQRQGFSVWLPTIDVEKVRRGKLTHVIEPMFSRYLFIQLDKTQSNWSPIRSTLGVSKLVSFGNVPAVVPDTLIESLRQVSGAQQELLLKEGDAVRFVSGPLQGLEGILQQRDGELRAMVLIELISQPQRINAQLSDLRPLAN